MPATSQRISVGKTTFRSTYADANALWRVIGKKGKDCYLCQIQNEPVEIDGTVYSGDYVGVEKVFMRSEIQRSLQWESFFDQARGNSDTFYKSLRVGQTVHYHNGFGAYIRCEVVEGKKLKSVALLGNWHSHELPSRLSTGEILDTYWSKQIKEGELSKPDASNIWEFYFTSKNKKPNNMIDDPTFMEPINLELPEMTQDQKLNADLWTTVNGIRDILNDHSGNPQEIIDSVIGFLKTKGMK